MRCPSHVSQDDAYSIQVAHQEINETRQALRIISIMGSGCFECPSKCRQGLSHGCTYRLYVSHLIKPHISTTTTTRMFLQTKVLLHLKGFGNSAGASHCSHGMSVLGSQWLVPQDSWPAGVTALWSFSSGRCKLYVQGHTVVPFMQLATHKQSSGLLKLGSPRHQKAVVHCKTPTFARLHS